MNSPKPASPNADPGGLDAFLNPNSMLTPGILGAIVMLGTNSLNQLQMIQQPIYISFFLSLLCGGAVIVKTNNIFHKILYYIINSLIIFSVAVGSNEIGKNAPQVLQRGDRTAAMSMIMPISPAYAFENKQGLLTQAAFFSNWFNTPASSPQIYSLCRPRRGRLVPVDDATALWWVVSPFVSTRDEAVQLFNFFETLTGQITDINPLIFSGTKDSRMTYFIALKLNLTEANAAALKQEIRNKIAAVEVTSKKYTDLIDYFGLDPQNLATCHFS